MSGGDGPSVFHGSTGRNEIQGYGDDDWVVYSEPVQVDLSNGRALHNGQEDWLYDIENVRGSEGDDVLIGDEQANVLLDGYDSSGDDELYGGAGIDSLETGLGNDLVEGGPGSDGIRIYCCVEDQDGDDTYRGGSGDDYIHAGLGGRDAYDGGDGSDVIAWSTSIENEGVIADLDSGQAQYRGQVSTLTAFEDLWGTAYDDELYGDEGDNDIHAGFGDDLLDGRDGSDYLNGALGEDRCLNGERFRRCEQTS